MVRYTGAYTPEETAAFLDEAVVPIRLACSTPRGGLWMLSLWYRFEDEQFLCATHAAADVVEYVEHDPSVAFEVSTNDAPYRGVRGAGRARIEPDEDKQLLRTLLDRYRGGTDTPLARELLSEDREEVRIVIEPTKLYAWDFSERMAPE